MQLSVKDVSRLLNVAEKTIYRWIQSGGLPAYRV
ncbi:MAG TPA: helix-turn-helix domain-containing protein, partial [Candidatus Aminicenantes bacterium]|nr:helix-turn-helix domain-containing protein [Candidatus Aminicenantes bacterium]